MRNILEYIEEKDSSSRLEGIGWVGYKTFDFFFFRNIFMHKWKSLKSECSEIVIIEQYSKQNYKNGIQ